MISNFKQFNKKLFLEKLENNQIWLVAFDLDYYDFGNIITVIKDNNPFNITSWFFSKGKQNEDHFVFENNEKIKIKIRDVFGISSGTFNNSENFHMRGINFYRTEKLALDAFNLNKEAYINIIKNDINLNKEVLSDAKNNDWFSPQWYAEFYSAEKTYFNSKKLSILAKDAQLQYIKDKITFLKNRIAEITNL